MNKVLLDLDKEQLIELAEIYSKNWLACDFRLWRDGREWMAPWSAIRRYGDPSLS